MSVSSFSTFFQTATGNASPYDYQCRLAGGDAGRECESQLISIPTGLGKTAAVVLAWLWNRVHHKRDDWPGRLVYCLPMRTLVEQTKGEAEKWLQAHRLLWDGKSHHAGKWVSTCSWVAKTPVNGTSTPRRMPFSSARRTCFSVER